ncbi:MAG: alpha/beta fold hydrolase [Flavobacteriales bacterium]|nr:alpha/beta fold hydrolase [Flavobacteriales bacterium]
MAKEKPVLLLIHGFPLDAGIWQAQRDALADLATVIAPDLRGFGASTLEVPAVLTMERFAEDLLQLLDERGVRKAVLCGLSMGGYVAMSFYERWPERVQGLLLCNTRSTADTEEGVEARKLTAKNAFDKGVDVIARGMLPELISARTKLERPELSAPLEAIMARQRADAVAAASLGMALRPDRTLLLRKVAVPTLVITGSADELMPLPTSEAMLQALPNGRLVVIPEVAHLSNLEAPEMFNGILREYLSALADA